MIKIIGGKYRSRLIEVPPEVTVPTKSRVREAIFSALSGHVEGERVLDLFAGSGAYAFEALSRGAMEADLVDCSSSAIAVIKRNKATLKEEKANIVYDDAFRFIGEKHDPYGLIFLDPPYKDLRAYREIPASIMAKGLLKEEGCLIVESENPDLLPHLEGCREKTYNYGRTFVRLLWRNPCA